MSEDEKTTSGQEEQEPGEAPLNRAERRARARQKKAAQSSQEQHAPTMKEMFSRKRSPFSGG